MEFEENYEEEVNALFGDLGEPEAPDRTASIPGLIETLHEQEGHLDPRRLALLRTVSALARYVKSACSNDDTDAGEIISRLVRLADALSEKGDDKDLVILRHRGLGEAALGPASQAADFVVSHRGICLDKAQAKALETRLGPTAPDLTREFEESALILAEAGISSLCLHLGAEARGADEDPYALAVSRNALCAYFATLLFHSSEDSAILTDSPRPVVISNEKRRPDPNFTILASVNGMRRGEVQVLVNQLSGMMNRAGARDPLLRFPSLFDAVFAFKKLVGVLKKPALEVNHVRRLLPAEDAPPVDARLAILARLVSRHFGDASQKSARILAALTAEDYDSLAAWQLADRLGLATELLDAVAIAASGQEESLGQADILPDDFADGLLASIEARLGKAPDEVYDGLSVSGEFLSASVPGGDTLRVAVSRRLLTLVAYFRQRSLTNRKMKSLLRHAAVFDDADYESVARDFGVDRAAAEELVGLLAGCFDGRGHFLRPSFEKSIPAFCRHEKKVFEFLWHYLKEHVAREDRIALLNALTLLINRISRPEAALGVLLSGYLADERISFSDRNALMLANILVRKFNKELMKDIRMTPEEVLRVKDGLDSAAADFAADFLDARADALFRKTRKVHRELAMAMSPYTWHDAMPLGYILTLEREAYILFALVGGSAAGTVLRSALWEYGNPESEIYGMAERKDQLLWLFHLLQVVIRAVGRVGGALDAAILSDIRSRKEDFLKRAALTGTQEQVRRLMAWADRSLENLEKRGPMADPAVYRAKVL